MKKTLKALRKMVGLTQDEAAELIGVSHDTISRWETGSTQPNALQIAEICRVYKWKFEDIIWPETKNDPHS